MTTQLSPQAETIFQSDLRKVILRTDRMFFWLLIGQWIFGILVALIWSPRTWIAQYWSIHQHVIVATVLGALFASYPLYLIIRSPGTRYTRHIIAIAQLLQSALLVHVTGGRIETHFHVFGSLALLAFYRDWPVLVTATIVVYVDHLALGFWFPLSVYGVPSATIWRSLEHAFWVVFEVVFLTLSCQKGIKELRIIADRQDRLEQTRAELQEINRTLEARVGERTQGIVDLNQNLMRDMAGRKKIEEALFSSEECARAIVESARDAIVSIDSTSKIVAWNKGAETTFGYTADEMIGKQLTCIMPERFRQMHRAGLARFNATGEAHVIGKVVELVGLRKGGGEFPVELSISKWTVNNENFFTGILRDITERKQTEEELKQKSLDLERSNKELDSFSYAVSHDLKAPLRGIANLSDWIVQDYSDKLDKNGKDQLKVLRSRVGYMQALIDGVLQYSRIGRVRGELVEIDLKDLITHVVGFLQPPPEIHIQIPDDLPKIHAEKIYIHQLFQNLLDNAIKFMDKPKGSIRIGCEDAGAHWRFSVSDNGPGIEQRYFDRIFQLFQTLEPYDKTGNTGVGLALVKKIVNSYGGSIQVQSELGKESTFFFTLPK